MIDGLVTKYWPLPTSGGKPASCDTQCFLVNIVLSQSIDHKQCSSIDNIISVFCEIFCHAHPILHFAPFLSTHFLPCLNPMLKNGSFLYVVALCVCDTLSVLGCSKCLGCSWIETTYVTWGLILTPCRKNMLKTSEKMKFGQNEVKSKMGFKAYNLKRVDKKTQNARWGSGNLPTPAFSR